MKFRVFYLFTLLLSTFYTSAQTFTYDILIKGGTVIDPKNNINAIRDVAIKDGKIAAVAADLSNASAKQIVDAKGLVVSPGLIDIHGHVFWGTNADRYLSDGNSALPPDGFTFRNGVTTIVDCGGAGWKNFALFKKNVIDVSRTRVLSFLNIGGQINLIPMTGVPLPFISAGGSSVLSSLIALGIVINISKQTRGVK